MVVCSLWQAGHDHVGVAYCLHLVHVESLDDLVEDRVELVQELHNLNSSKKAVGISEVDPNI